MSLDSAALSLVRESRVPEVTDDWQLVPDDDLLPDFDEGLLVNELRRELPSGVSLAVADPSLLSPVLPAVPNIPVPAVQLNQPEILDQAGGGDAALDTTLPEEANRSSDHFDSDRPDDESRTSQVGGQVEDPTGENPPVEDDGAPARPERARDDSDGAESVSPSANETVPENDQGVPGMERPTEDGTRDAEQPSQTRLQRHERPMSATIAERGTASEQNERSAEVVLTSGQLLAIVAEVMFAL